MCLLDFVSVSLFEVFTFLFFWPRTKLKGMRFSRSLPLRFKEEGLALDVPISWIDLPKGSVRFPILRLMDTINYMCKNDFLPKLMGETPETEMEDTLLKFWRRYSLRQPCWPPGFLEWGGPAKGHTRHGTRRRRARIQEDRNHDAFSPRMHRPRQPTILIQRTWRRFAKGFDGAEHVWFLFQF